MRKKFAPFTVECGFFQRIDRPSASGRHELHSSISWTRFGSDTSIPVAYIVVLVLSAALRLLRSDCCLLFNDRFYGRYQFRSAHRITHSIDEGSRCAGDPVVQAEIKFLQYSIGIDAAGHLAIKSRKINPNLVAVLT